MLYVLPRNSCATCLYFLYHQLLFIPGDPHLLIMPIILSCHPPPSPGKRIHDPRIVPLYLIVPSTSTMVYHIGLVCLPRLSGRALALLLSLAINACSYRPWMYIVSHSYHTHTLPSTSSARTMKEREKLDDKGMIVLWMTTRSESGGSSSAVKEEMHTGRETHTHTHSHIHTQTDREREREREREGVCN